MRRSVIVLALPVLLAACGSGGSASTVANVVTSSATTAVPPTTTAAARPTTTLTTTTRPTATTTTVVPWVGQVQQPAMPAAVLVEELGGPRPLEEVCLDFAATPPVENPANAIARVESWLGDIGTSVVAAGDCEVTLRLALTGHRLSAEYGSAGTCWTGYVTEGQLDLTVDGTRRTSWDMSRDVLPPYQILQGGCLRQDSAILFDISQLDSAFFDMIGGMADLAFHSHTGELGTRTVMQDRRQTPTDTELLALAHLMYQEPRWVQIAESWATWEPEVLLPLVPYLIRVADPDTCRSIDPAETCRWARDVAREVLEDISGEWYGAPEQWWAWWEGQSGP